MASARSGRMLVVRLEVQRGPVQPTPAAAERRMAVIHPPCDPIRVHLAKLQQTELVALVARERRARQVPIPSIVASVASLVRPLRQLVCRRMPIGARLSRSATRAGYASDKRTVQA